MTEKQRKETCRELLQELVNHFCWRLVVDYDNGNMWQDEWGDDQYFEKEIQRGNLETLLELLKQCCDEGITYEKNGEYFYCGSNSPLELGVIE